MSIRQFAITCVALFVILGGAESQSQQDGIPAGQDPPAQPVPQSEYLAAADFAIEEGQVYKEQPAPEFYLIKGGKKLWIPSMNVLFNLGFTTSQVRVVSNGRLAGLARLPDLNGPVLDALSIPIDAKVKPSDVFFGPFQTPEPRPVNAEDTQKDPNSRIVRNFYVAGWLGTDDQGRGPFPHCSHPDSKNPLCIEDFLYELHPDVDFLRQMYGPDGLIRIPSSVVLPGNPSANAKRLPFTNVDAAGSVSPNSLTLFNEGDVRMHVELNSWHRKSTGYWFSLNWAGRGPAPGGWVQWDGDNSIMDVRSRQAENWWPYYPYDPDGDGRGLLQTGQYVIMRGTLWEDGGHGEDANGNSEMDKVGLTGHGEWIEMHPPDVIIRSRPSPSCSEPLGNCRTKRTSVIARLVDSNQTIRDEQIAILVPDKPSPNNRQTFRIRYEEYVDTRFTTPAQVMDKRVAVQGDTLQLHLRLQNAGNRRGMFKATYVVWWEAEPANLPPARITLSPLSIDFGEQAIDMPSAARTATITNVGGTPGTINLSVPDPFWQRNTCGATLAPGASCTVSVAFTPIEPGSRSAVLTLGTALPQLIVSGVGFDPPRSGSLRTEDSTDRLDWVYEPGVAARDSVTFRICLPPQLDWSKSLRVLNGNAVLVNIGVQGKNSACVSQTVPVTALSGGQTIELWKAKFLGIPVRVRHGALSEFMPLRSSSRLTFTWQKD